MLDFSFRHWKQHSPYLKGFLALTLKRMDREKDAKLVWESVMDSAKTEEDQGTFWQPEDRAWLWYNDTIETHAFAIRTVMELAPQDKRLDGLVLVSVSGYSLHRTIRCKRISHIPRIPEPVAEHKEKEADSAKPD